jgi:hypothetical protein
MKDIESDDRNSGRGKEKKRGKLTSTELGIPSQKRDEIREHAKIYI